MFIRNPSQLHEKAEYLKHRVVSSIGGFSGGISSQADFHELLAFIEDVISKTTESKVNSPFKAYSPTKKDPFSSDAKVKPPTTPSVKATLSSSSKYNELERKARLGDESSIYEYLQALDHQGKIELEHLWVCPFSDYWYYSNQKYEKDLFPFCFPYEIGMNFDSIKKVLDSYGISQDDELKGAFVVDVATLEVADKVSNDLSIFCRDNLTNKSISTYIPDLTKHSILQADAILVIERNGVRLNDDLSPLRDNERSTTSYWQSEALRVWREGGRKKSGLGPIKSRWPQREIRQKLVPQLPERSPNLPYVIVLHMKSQRAFALNGQYQLIDENVAPETLLFAMRYSKSSSFGWFPTQQDQSPAWAKKFPSSEYISYWTAS